MAEQSKQPRFAPTDRGAIIQWFDVIQKWSKDALVSIPDYEPDTRKLDKWLREFYRQEPLLSGVVSSVVSIDKNRGWTLTGGRNQVARFTKVLKNPNPVYAGGEFVQADTWRKFASQQSESFWVTNMGAVTEKGLDVEGGRLASLWHVDSARCRLTGNVIEPLAYTPPTGQEQKWGANTFFRTTAMTSTDETFNGAGYSATMRAVQLAVIMAGVYRHDQEALYAAMQKGLLLMKGITSRQWEQAMQIHSEELTRREREYFAGVSVLFGDEGLDGKFMALSNLPDGFSFGEFTNVLMYGYALCFGYDPREFWPVSGGTLGTGKETEAQAMKATGKGGLDFALAWQDNIQKELPTALHFEFEQRNDEGKALEAQAIQAYAEAINTMAASPIPGMDTLSRSERRYLLASEGLIPQEWTFEEEDVTTTDTQDRLLEVPRIRYACEVFENEPIVQHVYPAGVTRLLWRSGAEALRRRSFPVVKRQAALYENTELGFSITNADVDGAIERWEAIQGPEFAGLLEAIPVEEVS